MNQKACAVDECVPLIADGLSDQEIHKRTGASLGYISQIRAVVERIRPTGEPRMTCPKCGANIPEGSRFCCKCGAKILTREEEIAERLEKCLSSAALLPNSAKDAFVHTVNEALKYFRERGKENAK